MALKTLNGIGLALLLCGMAVAAIPFAAVSADPLSNSAKSFPTDFAPNPNVGWIAVSNRYIPPPSGPGPLVPDPNFHRITNEEYRQTGRQPNFPKADLSNPILQPWVLEKLRKRDADIAAGQIPLSPEASCWPSGMPAFLFHAVPPVFFVQGPREVVIILEHDHQVRHVYLTDKHSAHITPSWYGESIGHYDGDTLVIDTIGIDTRTLVDIYQTPHTDKLHVVERYHVIDGGKTLQADLRIEDPGAFTTPWNAIQRFRRVEPGVAENNVPVTALSSSTRAGPLQEMACAENPSFYFDKTALPVPQEKTPDF